MLSTNGYRTFEMTRSNAMSRAKKSIVNYQRHLDSGVSDEHAAALRIFIEGQHEVIAEWENMKFHPGEW